MIAVVNHEKVIVGVESQPGRSVELAVAEANRAPLGDIVAVRVINRNALQEVVSHIQVVVLVQREGGGPYHLPVAPAVAIQLSEELVVNRSHLYAHDIERRRIAPAADENPAIVADNHVRGQMESPATLVRHEPNRVEILQGERLCGRLCSHATVLYSGLVGEYAPECYASWYSCVVTAI